MDVFKNQLGKVTASAGYQKALATQARLQPIELAMQGELANNFTTQTEAWWATKIASLNKNALNKSNIEESLMNQRLLNYLGLVAYMASSRAVTTGALSNAASYLKVFKMADPKNPDVAYISAICAIKGNNTKQAIASLTEAASLGYSEVATLLSEPAFSALHGDAEFIKVVGSIRRNYSGL
jgi:hypothetical protein